MEEIEQDMLQQSNNHKRNRQDKTPDTSGKQQENKKTHVMSLQENSTTDQSDMEDQDDPSKTKSILNSTPIPENLEPITKTNKQNTRQHKTLENNGNSKVKFLEHYFSVQDTPMNRNQTRNKHQTPIPETPDSHDKTTDKFHLPASRNSSEKPQNRSKRDQTRDDDNIIQELMNQSTQIPNMNNTLKILQLNKGNSELHNRTDQLNEILYEHKPHIFIICELNLELNDIITRKLFPNYVLEVGNLEICDQKYWTGMLIRRDIHYKRCWDLESQGT